MIGSYSCNQRLKRHTAGQRKMRALLSEMRAQSKLGFTLSMVYPGLDSLLHLKCDQASETCKDIGCTPLVFRVPKCERDMTMSAYASGTICSKGG